MRVVTLWLATILSPALALATTYTCQPPPETPLCQYPEKVDIAFIGTATETNYDPFSDSGTWFKFSVEQRLTGLSPGEREITVWTSLGSGVPEIGRRFFVHANRYENGRIYLASCGNTRPVEQAAEDIAYLLARQARTFQPYLSGSVLQHYDASQYAVSSYSPPPRGLAGVKVKFEGKMGLLETTTDSSGQFRLAAVTPGAYSISAEAPGYKALKKFTATVPNGGCGIAHLGLWTDARLSGVVRKSDGSPAVGYELELVDVDPKFAAPPLKDGDPVITDKNGNFSFFGLPSGRYLLGVNVEETSPYPDRTPPTYYPGVGPRADAQAIELKPNERKKDIVLTLLPPRSFRLVRVLVRWPDGSIPDRSSIEAWRPKGRYISVEATREGGFELRLLEGVGYWLTASAWDARRRHWIYPDSYRLPAGKGTVEVTLIPRSSWPHFLQVRNGEAP